jgi:transcriptional regulator
MFPWDRKKLLTKQMKIILIFRIRGYKRKDIGEILGIKANSVSMMCLNMKKRTQSKHIRNVPLSDEDYLKYSEVVDKLILEWRQSK